MKISGICLLLLSALMLGACSLLPARDSLDLDGTSWRLVSYAGVTPIPGREVTAQFDGKEISGSASCNHYFGTYRLEGDRIAIEGLGWTEMACLDPEGIMEQEQAVMGLLSRAASVVRTGGTLEIMTAEGELLAFEILPAEE